MLEGTITAIANVVTMGTAATALVNIFKRVFPHNIRAIMAEIKSPKEPHTMVIFWGKRISGEKIELEVIHISIKNDVSRQSKSQYSRTSIIRTCRDRSK